MRTRAGYASGAKVSRLITPIVHHAALLLGLAAQTPAAQTPAAQTPAAPALAGPALAGPAAGFSATPLPAPQEAAPVPAAVLVDWPEDCEAAERAADLGPVPAGLETFEIQWPDHDDPTAWQAPGAWERWGAALAADDASGTQHERIAHAARAALAQGRHESAWRHWTRLSDVDPRTAARLLPAFLPGIRTVCAFDGSGQPVPLEAGVTLAPALPPPTRTESRIDIRSMTLRQLRIGGAEIDLTVGVRGDGVELELEHRGGPAVEFDLRVPVPSGSVPTNLYADWEKQADPTGPVRVRLEPGAEPFRIWGRMQPLPLRWPGLPLTSLDLRMQSTGLALVTPSDDPWHAELADLARGLETLLEIPVRISDEAPEHGSPSPAAVRIHVPDLAERKLWLRDLVDAAERFAFASTD